MKRATQFERELYLPDDGLLLHFETMRQCTEFGSALSPRRYFFARCGDNRRVWTTPEAARCIKLRVSEFALSPV